MTKTAETMADARPRRRRATKREQAKRDLRFIEKLAAGLTVEEIAASEGISPQWVRQRKSAILARRAIDPPHEFIQLQVRRLSEAMVAAYSVMSSGNLQAVDRVVKIVRELDRYHGFGPHAHSSRFAAPAPAAPPPLALPEPPAMLAAPQADGAAIVGAASEPRDPTPNEDDPVTE